MTLREFFYSAQYALEDVFNRVLDIDLGNLFGGIGSVFIIGLVYGVVAGLFDYYKGIYIAKNTPPAIPEECFIKSIYCTSCDNGQIENEQCPECEDLHNQEIIADRLHDEWKGC